MNHQHDKDCEDILMNLSAYIDGELDPALCSAIEAHVGTCTRCQVVVNTLKKTIHLYQVDGQETKLPEETRRRLFASLDLEEYINSHDK